MSADMDVTRCLNPGCLVESIGDTMSERCRSWSNAAARSDSFLETIETWQPSLTHCSAIARPMPLLPPVIKTCLPLPNYIVCLKGFEKQVESRS